MYRALCEPRCLEEVTFLQLDLKDGFGLELTGKKHSSGIFTNLVGENGISFLWYVILYQ